MRRDIPYRRSTLLMQLQAMLPVNIMSLEIGVAAGDFSNFLFSKLSIKEHHMVDPWVTEGDDKRSQWFRGEADAQESYEFVVDRFSDKPVKIIREFSHIFLVDSLRRGGPIYDLIYVDGDHHSEAIYLDLVLSWEILKKGGILAGDDYNWQSNSTGVHEVYKGVQKFESTYDVKVNIVSGDGGGLDQYWIRK